MKQLYAKEIKREAIMVMKLSPDISDGSKKRKLRYGIPLESPIAALRQDILNVLRAAMFKFRKCEP